MVSDGGVVVALINILNCRWRMVCDGKGLSPAAFQTLRFILTSMWAAIFTEVRSVLRVVITQRAFIRCWLLAWTISSHPNDLKCCSSCRSMVNLRPNIL